MFNFNNYTMKKQLVLFVMFIVSVAAKAYDACIDGVYYNLKTEATVTYKDTNYNSYSGTVVIPDFVTYNGKTYSVTKIGSLAFASCSDLTSVTIPDGVGSIEERAFYGCISLTSVNFPNSITLIGNRAFAFCI